MLLLHAGMGDGLASAMYGMARCRRIQGRTITPPTPPLPVSHPFILPHPRHPFMADPFSRSLRGPIKRQAHSVCSEMCNVRKGERWEGGGEIPRRLTISSD